MTAWKLTLGAMSLASAVPMAAAELVTVTGLSGEPAETVVAYVGLTEDECIASERVLERRTGNVERRVRNALDALGDFAATFRIAQVQADGCWSLAIDVTPGEPILIDTFQFSVLGPLGAEKPILALQADPALKRAAPFDPGRYEALKTAVLDRSREIGYLDASFVEHRVEIDAAAKTADITWRLDGGTRYRVGPLTVNSSRLQPEFVARYLAFREGDPYTTRRVVESHQNLTESDYFNRVRVDAAVDQRADGRVPVSVVTTPKERWSTLTGVGFATDTGLRGRLDVEARYLNDQGHRGAMHTLASPVEGAMTFNYRWPYGDPTHQWYSLEPGVSYEDTDTAKSTTADLQFKRSQRVGSRWTHIASANLTVEDFEVGDQEGRSHLLLFTTHWSYTTGSDRPRPMHGTRVNVYARGAAQALGSDSDVLQAGAAAKQILPLAWGTRLILRGEVGWTWQDQFADLPPSLRFFAGGDNSVRGYGLDTLGEIENGEVIGGRKLLVGSVELDVPIRENWSLALFGDTGSAHNDEPDFSSGVGLGVRWFSPLGPIRVDLAHPLDDDRSVRLHISLGLDL